MRSRFHWLLSTLLILAAHGALAAEQKLPLFPHVQFTTSHGNFVVVLDGKRSPLSTRNFAGYVQAGHYDGLIFHRVISGFMAQAGGYDADLTEKPAKVTVPNESGNGLTNRRGTIAMARTGDPHSGSAQFFINLVDNERLDPNKSRGTWGYAVFGEVVQGMDVIDKIAELPTGPRGPFRSDVPQSNVIITKAELVDAPEPAPKPATKPAPKS